MLPLTNNYKERRNFQIELEAVLIGLLNRHFEIVIKRNKVKSSVTLSFIEISAIIRNQEVFELSVFVDQRIKLILENDIKNGSKQTTVMSKSKRLKIFETIHLLVDLLSEEGYSFRFKLKKQKSSMKMTETVNSIYCLNNDGIEYKRIKSIGKKINGYLNTELKKKEEMTLCVRSDSIQIFF